MPYHRSWLFVFLLLLGTVVGITPPPSALPADILIIAPHPDDAVLCCAGIIQQAQARGETVRVVNVTDGDGYKAAAAALFHKSETAMTPADMHKFGRIRRREELQALAVLGVTRKQVTFLGYPDGWLEEVYEQREETPQVSPHTGKSRTDMGRNFSRSALLNDIRTLVRSPAPKGLYVPSGHDDALDHRVVYRVIMDTINERGYTSVMHAYIIHMKDTANPGLSSILTIHLSQDEYHAKEKALRKYKSQMIPDRDYLSSFIQNTEMFY
jgi:LmbE family N-acetylglucosaminyl deacetylase